VPEYEAYGLSLYARGYLTADLCGRYREAVRRRGQLVTRMLERRLQGACEMTVSSPMAWLDDVDALSVEPAELAGALYARAMRQDGLRHDRVTGASPSRG
jgi:hypothetical protein